MKKNNLVGLTYGKLLVLEEEKDKDGFLTRVICQCKCGKKHSVTKDHLRRGNVTHCGCERPRASKHHMWTGAGDISSAFWYDTVLRSANGSKGNRKIKELTLTIEDAWKIFIQQGKICALSGIPIKFPNTSKSKDGTASLDRIDSSKGYIPGNVQWVHKHINLMKNVLSNDYFIEMCKNVSNFNKT